MKMGNETLPGGMAEFARLQARAGVGGRGRRSSLTRWMGVYHDEFAAMLADKEPGWDEVAVVLAELGLCDGQGKPPTGDRARKAWWAVRQEKATPVVKRLKASTPRPLAADEEVSDRHFVRLLKPDPDDVQQPLPSLEHHIGVLSGPVAASQDQPETGPMPASPALVARAPLADPGHLIPDGDDGNRLPPLRVAASITPSPLMAGQPLSDVPVVPSHDQDPAEVLTAGASLAMEPAPSASLSSQGEALADRPVAPAADEPAWIPQPTTPAAQEPATVEPGRKRGAFGRLNFWRRSAQEKA